MKKTIFLAIALAGAAAQGQNIISWQYANGNIIPSDGASFAGVVSAAYWNNSREAGVADLLANDGSSSGVSLGIADQYGAWGIGSVTAPDTDGTYNKAILDGYGNTATSDTLSLSGISYLQYNVLVYFSSDTDGRTGTISDGTTTYSFSTMGIAATSDSSGNAILTQTTDTGSGNPSADYAVFSGLSGSSQTLTLATSAGMGIAGMQIVAVPEPCTLALAGLGGLGLLLGRRRRIGRV